MVINVHLYKIVTHSNNLFPGLHMCCRLIYVPFPRLWACANMAETFVPPFTTWSANSHWTGNHICIAWWLVMHLGTNLETFFTSGTTTKSIENGAAGRNLPHNQIGRDLFQRIHEWPSVVCSAWWYALFHQIWFVLFLPYSHWYIFKTLINV